MDWQSSAKGQSGAEQRDDAFLKALQERLREVTARASKVREQVEEARRDLERLDNERAHLSALLELSEGAAPEQKIVPFSSLIADADKVVDLVREMGPLHYRQIFDLLQKRGFVMPGGMDPANTLLAKFFNEQRLRRAKRGTYELNDGRPSVGSRRQR